MRLHISDIPPKDSARIDDRIRRKTFERFVRANPDIEIIERQQIEVPGEVGEAGMIMAFAAGTAPDVIGINNRSIQQFVSQGFLYPLDTIPGYEPQPGLPQKQIDVLTYDGHIYGLVEGYQPVTIFYRRDFFVEAGLVDARGDPTPPTSWDELIEYSRRLTNPDEGRKGLSLHPSGWTWIPHVWQAGGRIIDQDELGNWQVVFNHEAGVAALELYRTLRWTRWQWRGVEQQGFAMLNTDGIRGQDLTLGKAAMAFCVGARMAVAYSNEELLPVMDKIGVAPPLTGPGPDGRKVNFLSTYLAGINGTVTAPDVLQAAWRYVRYLCSDEVRKFETDMLVQSGYARIIYPEYLERFGYGSLVADIRPATRRALEEIIEYGQPDPYCPNFMMVQTRGMQDFVDKILVDEEADPREELDDAVQEINAKILTPEVRVRSGSETVMRWVIAALLLALAAWLVWRFVLALRSTYGSQAQEVTRPSGDAGYARLQTLAWLFMAPALLSLLIWAYLPMLRGFGMAFQDYRVLGGSTFVGLDNFATAFTQLDFWMALWRTFYYVGLSLGIGFVLPIALALMLAEIRVGQYFFRTVYYLPTMTSGLVVMFLWKHLIFEPTESGLFNQALLAFGLEPQRWLESEGWAMICVVVPTVWAGVGAACLIYLAALKMVEESLYEAAAIDGAGLWSKLRHITLPSLKALVLINFVGAFIGSFHAMQNIFVMTGGGPNRATHIMGLEIFYNFVVWLKLGYATAIAWVLGFALIGFTIWQLQILRQVEFRAGAGEKL